MELIGGFIVLHATRYRRRYTGKGLLLRKFSCLFVEHITNIIPCCVTDLRGRTICRGFFYPGRMVLIGLAFTAIAACAGPTLKQVQVDPAAARQVEIYKQREMALIALVEDHVRLYRVQQRHLHCGAPATAPAIPCRRSGYSSSTRQPWARNFAPSPAPRSVSAVPPSSGRCRAGSRPPIGRACDAGISCAASVATSGFPRTRRRPNGWPR